MPPPTNHRDDVIKWKHFSRYWPCVRGIHRWPENSLHKGKWRGALIFYLRIDGWVNNREAGDLRRHHAHYDVIVMTTLTHFQRGHVAFIPRQFYRRCSIYQSFIWVWKILMVGRHNMSVFNRWCLCPYQKRLEPLKDRVPEWPSMRGGFSPGGHFLLTWTNFNLSSDK